MHSYAHAVFVDAGDIAVGEAAYVVDFEYLEDVFYTER